MGFFALFKTHNGSRYPLDVCFALLACGQTKSRHGKGWGVSKRESSSSQQFRLSIPACTCGVVGRMGISRARAPIQQASKQASKAERSNNRSWIALQPLRGDPANSSHVQRYIHENSCFVYSASSTPPFIASSPTTHDCIPVDDLMPPAER